MQIAAALGENFVLNIEHIGSTSVEGLAAKPTIDILVETAALNEELKPYIIRKLETIGYGNMRSAEREHRMTFGKGYDVYPGKDRLYSGNHRTAKTKIYTVSTL